MRAPLLAPLLVAALLVLPGCGSSGPAGDAAASAPAAPDEYVAAVQELLVPPARMASLAVERARATPDGAAPTREDVDRLINRARRGLEALRAQRLDSPALRRQRDALAGAYQATVARMERVGRDLVQDDRAALRRNLPTLFMSMRGLSSAVSSP